MKILVTGNKGYIGTILTEALLKKGYSVVGYDTGYYEDSFLVEPSYKIEKQIKKDM